MQQQNDHWLTYERAMSLVPMGPHRNELYRRWQAYSTAYRAFVEDNSNDTMINLIGTWARFSRCAWDIEEKYGRK